MSDATTRPAFDPEIARALIQHRDIVVTSMTRDDIPRVRAMGTDAPMPVHGAFDRHDLSVPGLDGGPGVPVIVLSHPDTTRPAPVLVFLHGGGLIAGTAESDLPLAADLAHAAGCAVVSVDYRLAPEHPYPAASDDVLEVLRWIDSGAAPVPLDPHRVVLSGISAGGGLAAAAAVRLRDHGGPAVNALLLMCPMLDHRSDSRSAQQMRGTGSWDAVANAMAWEAYLGDAAPTAHASAALADSLAGLPPLFIDVGSAETFRDECVEFASRVWSDGGDAELHVWPGGAHAFDVLAPWAHMSRAARAPRAAWLARVLDRLSR